MEKYSDFGQFLKDWRGKKSLMVIFPHPDDETMATGGLLLYAKLIGWKTIVVTLTKGDAGRLNIHPRGRTVSEIREGELKKAAKILKVSNLIIGDFSDGKLNNNKSTVISYVKEIIRKHEPGIVLTYDHSGITGHPDHITLSLIVKEIFQNGLGKKSVLFWSTLPKSWQISLHPLAVPYISKPTHILSLGRLVIKKYFVAKLL